MIFNLQFFGMLIVFILTGASTLCVAPVIDSMAMQFIEQGRSLNYTTCRSVGSVMWAVACVVLGWMMEIQGSTSLLLFQTVGMILMLICILSIET